MNTAPPANPKPANPEPAPEEDPHQPGPASIKIGLVGACGAGKTTVRGLLHSAGYTNIRHIAQEHSYVANMWQRLSNPDVLIYLEVSYENTIRRRKLDWTLREYEEQLRRLAHARQHADLIVDTNPLTPDEVLTLVLDFLARTTH